MWRSELWHPMVVHFPIVLLLGAVIARLFWHGLTSSRAGVALAMSRVMLYVGLGFAWIAVYTGTIADGVVNRSMCDPTVLEAHEQAAFTLGYLFSAGTVIDLLDLWGIRWITSALKQWAVTILLIGGSFYLGYTAHLGAKLVYQQSAAVYQPTKRCTEFE
ncbi:Uncharacterized membrane protein [Fodinibius sediminis]|uniref:Uncharacterized membrane protein n=2 Tax=Fodinibius sediminis TaxID=1214077 RepID=A0A521EFP4_9BACT|nr:Uncharacterized membrane protein [Fodinibius sediminis]